MEFLDLVKERASIRKFSNQEIEEEKVEKILEAGRLAPTACNFQPQRIYVIKSKEGLEKLQKCKTFHFGETLALLVCYDANECWKRSYDGKNSGDVDASIVTSFMMMEAQQLGISSTWIMHFIPEAVKEEFNIPDNLVPVSLLVLGYASDDAQPSFRHFERKDIKETTKEI